MRGGTAVAMIPRHWSASKGEDYVGREGDRDHVGFE
jgi:hypothetical protein